MHWIKKVEATRYLCFRPGQEGPGPGLVVDSVPHDEVFQVKQLKRGQTGDWIKPHESFTNAELPWRRVWILEMYREVKQNQRKILDIVCFDNSFDEWWVWVVK